MTDPPNLGQSDMSDQQLSSHSDSRPRLLDLFCGVGGCTRGYQRAGFYVVGVDIRHQPNYCGDEFYRADALTFPLEGFEVIHASPPCKRFTVARRVTARNRPALFEPHDDLLTPIRERLEATGVPYVIENVPGAPLRDPVTCCGSAFGLRVRRHRLFESNVPLRGSGCRHDQQPHPVGVYGDGGSWTRKAPGGGGVKVSGAEAAAALGIDWTDRQPELAQSIPPAYTEHIGRDLLAAWQSE